MVFCFVKHSLSTVSSKPKTSPMLSLSILGTPSTGSRRSSPSTTPTPKKKIPSSLSCPALSLIPQSMEDKTGGSHTSRTRAVREEAVTFLGLLRHNEDVLESRLKTLLKKDRQLVRDVFSCRIDEWTPVHACTLRGARKLVKMALKSGVSPDLEMGSPDGLPGRCSTLHLAAYRGDVSLVQLLAQHGATLNKRDSTRRTPLFYAASKNNALAARKLIKYGADVSELTAEQRTYYTDDIDRRPTSLLCIPVPSISLSSNSSSSPSNNHR